MNKYILSGVIVIILSLNLVLAIEGINIDGLNIGEPRSRVTPIPEAIGDPVNFVVHGDTHAGYDDAELIHREIVERIVKHDPDMIFNAGDVVHGQWGGPENWNIFHEIAGKLVKNYPYYPTIGNHDASIGVDYYVQYFPNLPNDRGNDKYYYVESEESIFIILDADSDSADANAANLQEQKDWLNNTLTEFSDKTYKFVMLHRPGYTSGSRGASMWVREFDPYFVDYGVDVVFSGHIHAYERFYVNGVHYVNTGGSGGVPHRLDLYHDYPFATREYSEATYNYVTVTGDEESLTIQARYPDGEVFDEFVIGPGLEYVGVPDESVPASSDKRNLNKRNIRLPAMAPLFSLFPFFRKIYK
ncbi:MAG: metallophosphoesterase [Parcubacteria group bacterium]|nr:metallophosphoesterase [Parcubacteria group bacterium]